MSPDCCHREVRNDTSAVMGVIDRIKTCNAFGEGIGTLKTPAVWTPAGFREAHRCHGRIKRNSRTDQFVAGPVRVPSVAAFAAIVNLTVPIANLGSEILAVQCVPDPFNVNSALPVPSVPAACVVTNLMSPASNPVTLLEKIIPTSNVLAICVPCGSL